MKIVKLIFINLISLLFCLSVFAVTPPEIVEDASIKAVIPAGLRTKAVISTDLANDEATSEYGFIITRKVFLRGAGLSNHEFTLDCPVYYVKGISRGIENGKEVDIFFEATDTEIYFTGHFYGISERFYREVIVARPYVVTGDGTYYGQPVEMNLYDTARKVKQNPDRYNELTDEQKCIIDEIVDAYAPSRQDVHIVTDVSTVINSDGTYSFLYSIFSPYTGDKLDKIRGTKYADSVAELGDFYEPGTVVGVKHNRVEDSYDDSVFDVITPESMRLIHSVDLENLKLYLAAYDENVKCKECVRKAVNNNHTVLFVDAETPVTVISASVDGLFESGTVTASTVSAVAEKNSGLLCSNVLPDGTVVYSDYVKVYASADEEGGCEYLLVIVNDGEKAALDEKCPEHTHYNVSFVDGGNVIDSQSILYGKFPSPPTPPEKEGYTFLGWSLSEDGEVSDIQAAPVFADTKYYAVFEKKVFTVTFLLGGELYYEISVEYGTTPHLVPEPALQQGTFLGWSLSEDGEITDISSAVITQSTCFYAVVETKQNDPNLIEIMTRGLAQLKKIRITANSKNDIARDLIVECMTYVLSDANAGIYIDKSYIYSAYSELAASIKKAIKVDMTESERSSFVNILTNTRNIDKDVQDFLIEYFNIDLSKI